MDDEKVGVKSTARLFAHHSRPILGAFSAATMGGLALAGHAGGLGGWMSDRDLSDFGWSTTGIVMQE